MRKIPVKVAGLTSSPSSLGSFGLLLAEIDGNRRLPIIIGAAEAQSIAIELEKVKSLRPLTHDLMKNILETLGGTVTEVVIINLRDGVFYARIYLEHLGTKHEIDSRPSDAIALAVRIKCDIFVMENVLEEAGIEVSEEDSPDDKNSPESDEPGSEEENPELDLSIDLDALEEESSGSAPKNDIEKLTEEMNQAILSENYEIAAKLRDQINKLKGLS